MESIRVGIVGCGRISGLHALGYRGREDARIEAVCDTKRGRAREKAKAWGVEKVYADYQRLLGDAEIDLVELLVPHHLHAELTIAACEVGLPERHHPGGAAGVRGVATWERVTPDEPHRGHPWCWCVR